ncbi:hypothetical protein [Bacterioplanes sanyensis]|nr:hypothetical protein [Bacterioplanes sanyensis]
MSSQMLKVGQFSVTVFVAVNPAGSQRPVSQSAYRTWHCFMPRLRAWCLNVALADWLTGEMKKINKILNWAVELLRMDDIQRLSREGKFARLALVAAGLNMVLTNSALAQQHQSDLQSEQASPLESPQPQPTQLESPKPKSRWYLQAGLTQERLETQLNQQRYELDAPGATASVGLMRGDWNLLFSGQRVEQQQSGQWEVDYWSRQWSVYVEYLLAGLVPGFSKPLEQDYWLGVAYSTGQGSEDLSQTLPQALATQQLSFEDDLWSLDIGTHKGWDNVQGVVLAGLARQSSRYQQRLRVMGRQSPLQRVDTQGDDVSLLANVSIQAAYLWNLSAQWDARAALALSRRWRLRGEGSVQAHSFRPHSRTPVQRQSEQNGQAAAISYQDVSMTLFYRHWDVGFSWQRSSEQGWPDGYRAISLGIAF